tara:strand:+ start:383 stop:694 length:312 start_codon:yes stop_codon:yes gene_type:complete
MSNKNKEEDARRKIQEMLKKELDANIFKNILTAATISSISAVFAVKVKERISNYEDECKTDNSSHTLCSAYLDDGLRLIIFFVLTLLTAIFVGILFYYIFDKK